MDDIDQARIKQRKRKREEEEEKTSTAQLIESVSTSNQKCPKVNHPLNDFYLYHFLKNTHIYKYMYAPAPLPPLVFK